MNPYILFAMVALGIGGGFLGLAWGWREGERESYARRTWARFSSTLHVGGEPVAIAGPVTLNMVPASESAIYIRSSGGKIDGIYLTARTWIDVPAFGLPPTPACSERTPGSGDRG